MVAALYSRRIHTNRLRLVETRIGSSETPERKTFGFKTLSNSTYLSFQISLFILNDPIISSCAKLLIFRLFCKFVIILMKQEYIPRFLGELTFSSINRPEIVFFYLSF